MSDRLTLRFLPARQGDAIWVSWGDGHQLLIDMGTPQVGRQLLQRLAQLPEELRRFDLLIITHVDSDHIGGVLTGVAQPDTPLPGLEFDDVWFNGWEHLQGKAVAAPGARAQLEALGPAQGEELSTWLRSRRWNEAFDRGPAMRRDAEPVSVSLPGGVQLTVLGPTLGRLAAHRTTWQQDVAAAIGKGRLDEVSPGLEASQPGLERLGLPTAPALTDERALSALADTPYRQDPSRSNACSITVLLTWRGRSVLLTGDAYAEELVDGLRLINTSQPVDIDVIKVPHHGSQGNVTDEFVRSVRCPYWVFSSDGSVHRHPDAVAIARLLRSTHVRPTLGFNVASAYNRWWDDSTWMRRFRYAVEYGSDSDGLTLQLAPA